MYLEIITGIIALLLVVLLIMTLVFHFRKPDTQNFHEEFVYLDKEFNKNITDLRVAVNQSINESIMTFNDKVNIKLSENNEKSTTDIANFRLNVNNELSQFQDKISTKLNGDFLKLTETIEKQMSTINEKVEDRLKNGFVDTNKTFIQIAERIKVIDEAQKNIEALSSEMMGLQQILTNNQTRGSFGEYQLNQLLFSVFGDNNKLYELQKTIKEASGKSEKVRADAVIYMPEPYGVIAIDSKFPFSEYAKLFDNKNLTKEEEDKIISAFGADVKKRITEISSKYIIEGVTVDFALMFVASDGVLSLLHSKLPNVIEYSANKKVTIVSPTTLIPLLSSFLAIRIDYERSKYSEQIKDELSMLKKEFIKFDVEWAKLHDNIQKLTKQSIDVNSRVEKISTKFNKISTDKILNYQDQPLLSEDNSEED